ncbi:MAG: hypothetical protein HQ523_07725 [Lentisphaerae bacterium]|nr:hypothetical protein [Lentisphaerota bacterium]
MKTKHLTTLSSILAASAFAIGCGVVNRESEKPLSDDQLRERWNRNIEFAGTGELPTNATQSTETVCHVAQDCVLRHYSDLSHHQALTVSYEPGTPDREWEIEFYSTNTLNGRIHVWVSDSTGKVVDYLATD